MNTEKLFRIIKYLLIYSLFIFFTLFSKIPCWLFGFFRFFPDINLILIFIVILWLEENKISKNNLFFFGLIIDILSDTPLGLSSACLLISCRLTEILRSYMMKDENLSYFIRDLSIYLILCYISKWFILSYYKNIIYPIKPIIFIYIKDIICSIMIYFLCKKTIK